MHRLRVPRLVMAAFAASVLLVACLGQRKFGPASPGVPLDDWDIPQLVAFLNEHGLDLRVRPTMREGAPGETAFLTITDKRWEDFNGLPKDPKRIASWQGTLYCERGASSDDWSELTRQWGDCYLVAGPFLFFGDPQLLARVRDTLA